MVSFGGSKPFYLWVHLICMGSRIFAKEIKSYGLMVLVFVRQLLAWSLNCSMMKLFIEIWIISWVFSWHMSSLERYSDFYWILSAYGLGRENKASVILIWDNFASFIWKRTIGLLSFMRFYLEMSNVSDGNCCSKQ